MLKAILFPHVLMVTSILMGMEADVREKGKKVGRSLHPNLLEQDFHLGKGQTSFNGLGTMGVVGTL